MGAIVATGVLGLCMPDSQLLRLLCGGTTEAKAFSFVFTTVNSTAIVLSV